MHEILRNLRPGARVLDLGALTGSFPLDCCCNAFVVRVDLEWPGGPREGFVQADARRLPFRDHCFDVLIANHSFEHIHDLAHALAEIGRVVDPKGSLYVAVPDASTFSDRLFRWIYREESGHVNPFCSAEALAFDITRATGIRLCAIRALCSSFEYLNRYYFGSQTSWRLRIVGNGNRRAIVALSYAARLIDRIFHTRMSAYGWALYFGEIGEPVDVAPRSNVCVGCGAGHVGPWLLKINAVQRHFLGVRCYRCPSCGSGNVFMPD